MRSTSSMVMPQCSRTLRMAGLGPIPMIEGSTPDTDQPVRRASGVRLCLVRPASEVTMRAAAPSPMPEALAAVTVPFFLNTGGSLAMASTVAFTRGVSSRTMSMAPFFLSLTDTGAISASNTPASKAAFQRIWDWSAYASASSREMPYFSARFSAVRPMGICAYESVRAAHRVSCSVRSMPRRWPKRTAWPYTDRGAWDMDSEPPASTTSAWPSMICSAAVMTDWKPLPHRRFRVSAVEPWRMPARRPAWRARYGASTEVCATLPQMEASIAAGSTPQAAMAALLACVARSVAVSLANEPPKDAMAVRFAAAM
mmetsp:Transcript_2230/g.8617  ORF Transcript_2230/g.8617 Transcript_2230/m.8617 type:complete len:313 (+) Transcript_2230:611-1549(+)